MNSRESILNAIKTNQPDVSALPDLQHLGSSQEDTAEKFITMLTATGGKGFRVNSYEEIVSHINTEFPSVLRIVTTIDALSQLEKITGNTEDPHLLANVDIAVIPAHFGVAENAAVWVTEDLIKERALPFISQNLAVVIREEDIVANMHEAYGRIGNAEYGFATFIAGPSKTADIEQSLVLGAHGPKSMMVFLMRG